MSLQMLCHKVHVQALKFSMDTATSIRVFESSPICDAGSYWRSEYCSDNSSFKRCQFLRAARYDFFLSSGVRFEIRYHGATIIRCRVVQSTWRSPFWMTCSNLVQRPYLLVQTMNLLSCNKIRSMMFHKNLFVKLRRQTHMSVNR